MQEWKRVEFIKEKKKKSCNTALDSLSKDTCNIISDKRFFKGIHNFFLLSWLFMQNSASIITLIKELDGQCQHWRGDGDDPLLLYAIKKKKREWTNERTNGGNLHAKHCASIGCPSRFVTQLNKVVTLWLCLAKQIKKLERDRGRERKIYVGYKGVIYLLHTFAIEVTVRLSYIADLFKCWTFISFKSIDSFFFLKKKSESFLLFFTSCFASS